MKYSILFSSFCLITPLFIFCHCIIPVVHSQCLEDQKTLLLQLKRSLQYNSSHSTRLVTWNSDADCCGWGGVTCDPVGRVTGLDLNTESISGGINSSSSHLFRLHYLETLNLANNYFYGVAISSGFGRLSNLMHLNLSSCGFQGTFPEKIFQLSTLQTVDLHSNGELQGSLPEFPHNGSLQTLSLSDTNFSGRLPNSIGSLGMLSSIQLHSCSFSGPIPNSMANLTQLVSVNLSCNMFTGPIPSFRMSRELVFLDLSHNQLMGTIPSTHFEGLAKLEKISLNSNSFNGSVPSSLFQLSSLQTLDLSFNKFGGLVDEFSNASSTPLEILDLSSNNLQGPVPMSFFELANLTQLFLSSNNFSGTIRIQEIHRLCSLSELDLSHNKLWIDTSDSNSTLYCTPILKTLSLASCKQEIFPDLHTLSSLSDLDLSDNQISGEIPNWIWEVRTLSQLNLSHNYLTGVEKPYVFPSSHLDSLDLHSNQLHGEIPIPNQRARASYIDYSGNNFSSTIPVDIVNNLISLVFFSLSNNSIVGTIPQSLCNARRLQFLDLSNNDLSGTIPSCLLAMDTVSLDLLNLRNNKLSGYIPMSFNESCSLKTLYLDGNHLGGHVPKSLGNCSKLEVLNLGKNNINDSFPCFLKNLSSLQILVLQSNWFHGDIPCDGEQRGGWPNLHVIDLSNNSFGGNLPQIFFSTWSAMKHGNLEVHYLRLGRKLRSIQSLSQTSDQAQYRRSKNYMSCVPKSEKMIPCKPLYGCRRTSGQIGGLFNPTIDYYIKVTITNKGLRTDLEKIISTFSYVDFSNNKFYGKIPRSIGDLKFLIALNLSSNAFTSTIPSSLGNLNQLESLDLSNNQLIGKIPVELASLTFLAFMNVSHNLLEGRIPHGPQFQTFAATSFQGNMALCGSPLINQSCKETGNNGGGPSHDENKHSSFLEADVYISVEVGFIVGLAFTMGPIMFSRRWRQWFYRQVDRFIFKNMELRRK